MNNLGRYQVGDKVLLARHDGQGEFVEVKIIFKVEGQSNHPTVIKGEQSRGLLGKFATWYSAKAWEVAALVEKGK